MSIHALSTIPLFDSEPDLLRFLGPEEAARAAQTRLPVHALPKGFVDAATLLDSARVFGAFIVEGMLLQPLQLGGHAGQRLLGPGDAITLADDPESLLRSEPRWRAPLASKLVVFDRELMLAIRRWPGLAVGLHAYVSERNERLTAQLLICQMPRVNDRLLALMWLIADTWGTVTTEGTLVPVPLTHATLGALIGARRATVTLALGALTSAGTISRSRRGWLLHKPLSRSLPAGAA